jgi:hypothetical protein
MRSGMKKWGGRILLFFLGLIVAFTLLEILSRIFWTRLSELENVSSISFVTRDDYEKRSPHPFVWLGQIGNIHEFSVEISRNSLGFHDIEHTWKKPEGTFRIVVLGDSFTEALQVPLEKTYPKIIEEELNKREGFPVEVISLGRSGAGTKKSLDILKEMGLRFQPDLVLMQFLSNDLIDNSPRLNREKKNQEERKKKYIPSLGEAYHRFLWVKPSRFNQLAALKLARIYQGLEVAKFSDQDKYGFTHLSMLIFAEEYSDLWVKPWRTTQRYILQSEELSRDNLAKFVLISFPGMWRIGSLKEMNRRIKTVSREALNYHWDFNKTDRILRDFCQKKGMAFLSLLPEFRESYRASHQRLHFAYDMHLNERGHRVAAAAILKYILEKKLIPDRVN